MTDDAMRAYTRQLFGQQPDTGAPKAEDNPETADDFRTFTTALFQRAHND